MEVNFSFKQRYRKNSDIEFAKGVNIIKPTPFKKDYEVDSKVFSSIIERIGTKVYFENESIKRNKFITFDPTLLIKIYNKGIGAITVLTYIANNLKYNSNCINFSYNDIEKISGIKTTSIREAIGCLCDNNIIAKTTIQGEYIVNHNYMFYGKLEEFVKAYDKLYGNIEVKLDINGKVIIPKDIKNLINGMKEVK